MSPRNRFLLLLFPLLFASGPALAGPPPPAATAPGPPPQPEYPTPETVTASMKRAASYFRTHVAFAGGYAWTWPVDRSEARGENRTSPTLIMIQPPGTPTVGRALLEAYRVTEDKLFLQGAKEAAQALLWCQMASGGWGSDFDFDPRRAGRLHFRRDLEAGDVDPGKRGTRSTLDDSKTQSAIGFLLELAHTRVLAEDANLRTGLDFALDGLLAAQAPNGGWPQQFTGPAAPDLPVVAASFPKEWPRIWPAIDYTGHYTLNDNNLLGVMRLLIRADALEGGERYLAAARRLGDFLLLAQLPEPQPAWAQQYNVEMHPVWARKFEPPAVSSIESLGAIQALFELWLATGEGRFVATLPAALDWLDRSRIGPDETWARFYELETNRPLYCRAETYEVTHDDADVPTHYGFKISGSFARKIRTLRENLERDRKSLRAERNQRPEGPGEWTREARDERSRVRDALRTQSTTGAWLNGDGEIDARLFVGHFERMATYLEGAHRGGETFRQLQEESERKRPARVGGIVISSVRGDKEANWDRVKVLIREAAGHGAEIVCTPASFLDGYRVDGPTIPPEALRRLGEPFPDGKYVIRLRDLADELDIHLVVGMIAVEGEERHDVAAVFGPDGGPVETHRKPDADALCFVSVPAGLQLCPAPGSLDPTSSDAAIRARSKEAKLPVVLVHPAAMMATDRDGSIAALSILEDAASAGVYYTDVPVVRLQP